MNIQLNLKRVIIGKKILVRHFSRFMNFPGKNGHFLSRALQTYSRAAIFENLYLAVMYKERASFKQCLDFESALFIPFLTSFVGI